MADLAVFGSPFLLMEDAGFTLTEDWQPGWYISGVELAAITGTLACTVTQLSNAIVGAVAISGAVAATAASLTSADVGAVSVRGPISAGLAALTAAVVGQAAVGGTLAATLTKLAGSVSGGVSIVGTIAGTLSPVVMFATDSESDLRAFCRIPGLKCITVTIHTVTIKIKIP